MLWFPLKSSGRWNAAVSTIPAARIGLWHVARTTAEHSDLAPGRTHGAYIQEAALPYCVICLKRCGGFNHNAIDYNLPLRQHL